MKLRYSQTSPFVRKVWAAALATGLADGIERIMVSPVNPEDVRNSPNPLGKIPCLETDDGLVLYDSPVIVDYLDTLHGGTRLVPESGPPRWHALRRQALADGICESATAIMIENMRKEERRSKAWIGHNMAQIDRAIAALEQEAPALGESTDIGLISIAIALDVVDMYFPDKDWRADHGALGVWFDAYRQRPYLRESELVNMWKRD